MTGGRVNSKFTLLLVAAEALLWFSQLQPRGAVADLPFPFSTLPNRTAGPMHRIPVRKCAARNCGKGTCQESDGSCKCDPGWSRLFSYNESLKFLPCVIPSCAITYSCSSEAPPPPPPPPPPNLLPFDLDFYPACSWASCGEGSCIKFGIFNYRCDCRPGTKKLLDLGIFPCFTDVVLGDDCPRLLEDSSAPALAPSSPSDSIAPASLPNGGFLGANCSKLGLGLPNPLSASPSPSPSSSTPADFGGSRLNAAIGEPKLNATWLSILTMILALSLA